MSKRIFPSICLNMIVKNESHIIKKTLENLCEKINFSYWVICDTGSTDNTREIITDFFKNKNISGELHNDDWKNFAHNRTLALNYAFCKTDLLFIFDADDEIVGDFNIPKDTRFDEYHLQFGSALGTSYTRCLLINNQKRFIYKSVLHEFITCIETVCNRCVIEGNYYVVSGRSGSRNQDPQKYLKDALILEEAYAKALEENDDLYKRYAFYCANSYRDYGDYENAIKWYKITLNMDSWAQEKYISCLSMYDCYSKLKQVETGFFYLVKAFQFDTDRVEALLPLIVHYSCENQFNIAYGYYLIIKDFYENKYLSSTMNNKLFISIEKYDFLVPYHMIIIADRVNNYDCGLKMFEIIFTKKMKLFELWYIKNLLFNLQFFIKHVKPENKDKFMKLTNEYIRFLHSNNVDMKSCEYLKDYDNRFGLDVGYIFNYVSKIPQIQQHKTQGVVMKKKYSKEECEKSKNILIYTGFCDTLWNYSHMANNALGGSEKAVNYLAKAFPKEYTIFVAGTLANEINDNVIYIHLNQIPTIINTRPFKTIICSRYIAFLEMFKECCFDQFYIWAHDTHLIHYGCDLDVKNIFAKWNDTITGCICLTNWHSELYKKTYPELENKISIINNGVNISEFKFECKKQPNKFIYSSRPERGLGMLLKLWPQIIEKFPDATLVISSYGDSPPKEMLDIIENNESIKYLGKLNAEKLYYEMSTSEYWLYPTPWPETSCITSLEMLMSEVICLYYPLAGLNDTIGDYGIKVLPGNEIDTIMSLTEDQKDIIRKRGKEYAISCSWDNRANEWCKILFKNEPKPEIKNRINELHSIGSIPKPHVDYLKKIANDFEPNIIYDIGANVLSWTREARKIWPSSEIVVFDAIQTAEFLYKENNLKYHIGVLSKEDNTVVKFYENIIHPAGNSYYKEIGHNKSNDIYPEESFTEQKTHSLSSVVSKNNFPLPDLIKIDVQGAELDIIKGGIDIINHAKYLIVELQDTQYNRGAPLADVTIKFLENNDWELVAPKFCDNGPDADYCFKNKKFDKDFKWLFILPSWYKDMGVADYLDNLKTLYNIEYTKDPNFIFSYNPTKVTFVYDIQEPLINYCKLNNIDFSYLNTEPMVIDYRLQVVLNSCKAYDNIKIYDYSKSNIKILHNNVITNTEYLPYVITEKENTFLHNINKNTKKLYDFGIISYDYPISCIRRNDVVKFLTDNGFKVSIICNLWKEQRDYKLAECKYILNIHGAWQNRDPSHIFEHIRCDRLLEAGYNILSEESYYLDPSYIARYKDNLKIISYNDFFNLDTYKNLKLLMTEIKTTRTRKIIDCFTFYNELKMLTYRLNVLNDVVDYFILVEANHTHSGCEKPLYFNDNKHLYEKFKDKIIHIVVDLPLNIKNIDTSKGEQWTNERFQRNCIKEGFNKIELSENDLIIISDVDEIPDPNVLNKLKIDDIDIDIRRFEQDFYYYNLESKRREKWYHSKILSYKKYKELNTNCDNLRFMHCDTILKGGWHLSYFGDTNFIKNKLVNFAHQEYNSTTYTDTDIIQQKIDLCVDLFGRPNNDMIKINIKDNDYLPPLYDTFLKSFYKNI